MYRRVSPSVESGPRRQGDAHREAVPVPAGQTVPRLDPAGGGSCRWSRSAWAARTTEPLCPEDARPMANPLIGYRGGCRGSLSRGCQGGPLPYPIRGPARVGVD